MKRILAILFAFSVIYTINVDAKETKLCKTNGLIKTCYYKKAANDKNYTKIVRLKKYKNKQKQQLKIIFRDNNGKNTLVKVFNYNKKGKLKSNSNGKATRKYYFYYSNNKISKRITWNYNSKGKLKNKKTDTKKYLKNKPLTLGRKLVNNGKKYLKSTLVCSQFIELTLEKSGFKYLEKKKSDEYGDYISEGIFYTPDEYKYSSAIVIENSSLHKYYLKKIDKKEMKKSQLMVVKDRAALIKNLRIGDVIGYGPNGYTHVAMYSGKGYAIQGGLGFKKDDLGRKAGVGYAPIDLGSKLKINDIVRIHKIVN